MPIVQTLHKGRVPVHIYTDEIDHTALQQLLNIANLPVVHPHVAAMPNVHAGEDTFKVLVERSRLVSSNGCSRDV